MERRSFLRMLGFAPLGIGAALVTTTQAKPNVVSSLVVDVDVEPIKRLIRELKEAAPKDGWRTFTPGDVVIDKYDGKRVTVERVIHNNADVVWFEGSTLHRGSLLQRNLIPANG